MLNQPLWNKILAYPMPADLSGRSFNQQLRDDQKISEATADRGILEYKRFLYLCATGTGRCVPTRAVDAVWHLHLTHTRDYWERFVPEVLEGRPIHHTPGAAPGQSDDFAETLRRYALEFGEDPPIGIWRRVTLGAAVFRLGVMMGFCLLWFVIGWTQDAPTWVFVAGAVMAFVFAVSCAREILEALGLPNGSRPDIWSDRHVGDCGDWGAD